MTGADAPDPRQPDPRAPELRISDADRDRAVQRLNDAVSEGRLTMDEFDQRVAGVLRARTDSELQPYLVDLPAPAGAPAAPERAELRTAMSTINRTGRWVVPRRLSVNTKMGTVKLDFTEAVIGHPVVELAVESYAGTVVVVTPPGASVDADQVELVAGSVTISRKVTRSVEPAGRPHLTITGKLWAGSVKVRPQRRFLWWRW